MAKPNPQRETQSEGEAKPPPQHTRKEVDESRKRGGGEAEPAAQTQTLRNEAARRRRSRPRSAKPKIEEAAKPPPQHTRKEGNNSRKRGSGAAAPAALKKEAALIKITHDQSGRGRGNLLPSYSSWQPVHSAEDNGTSPQRGITSPVFAKQKLGRKSLQDVVVESLSLYAPKSCP